MLFVQEIAHETFGGQLFEVLISTLEPPEPGVHSHAPAAMVTSREGIA